VESGLLPSSLLSYSRLLVWLPCCLSCYRERRARVLEYSSVMNDDGGDDGGVYNDTPQAMIHI